VLEPESHSADQQRICELLPEKDGYFAGYASDVGPGLPYRFRLDGGSQLYPDPASRFQPQGPHGPSEIFDPMDFEWTDSNWRGVGTEGQVLYEMHIGTFSKDGTWDAAARELAELADLGVTVLEIMPVADFPGRFGWGYDGVNLFAPTRLYGRELDKPLIRAGLSSSERTSHKRPFIFCLTPKAGTKSMRCGTTTFTTARWWR
jgi:maltooligosyltrehalose trehalohydrolase